MPHTQKTFCSICSAFCGFEATVENNIVTDFVPDKDHRMSRGFSCTKGRSFHSLLTAESRQTRVLKRSEGGSSEVDKKKALDEVAQDDTE